MDNRTTSSGYSVVDPILARADYRNYGALKGGEGKEVNFRQQRYMVKEFLKDVESLRPAVLCQRFEGTLVDFSISGASASILGSVDVTQGEIIHGLRIVIGQEELYSGRAKVAYVTQASRDGKNPALQVGLQLMDHVIDLGRMFWARSSACMQDDLNRYSDFVGHDAVDDRYKARIADLVFLMSSFRTALRRREMELETTDASLRPRLEIEILEMAWSKFGPRIFAIQDELDSLTQHFYSNRAMQKLYREYTMPLITPLFVSAPYPYRAWAKPLGYPGDYRCMQYLYDRKWEGDDLYAKLVHKYSVEHPLGEAVRARRDLLKRYIFDAIERVQKERPGEPTRLVSLGAGPAQEIVEVLSEYIGGTPLHITLIDQDNAALALVNRLISERTLQSRSRVETRYLYIAFSDLLRDRGLFESIIPADFVYSAGLFDYLGSTEAGLVLQYIFSRVRSGGQVAVGNFRGGPPPHAWSMSYILDWNLRYRSREEMAQLGNTIADRASSVEVVTEYTERQYFISAFHK